MTNGNTAPDDETLALAHALFDAAREGNAALLGGNANAANDRGQTPLAGAVFKGYADVVQVLVEAGADPDAGTPSARAAAQMFARADLLALLG
jgi:ankyrin repeat protein